MTIHRARLCGISLFVLLMFVGGCKHHTNTGKNYPPPPPPPQGTPASTQATATLTANPPSIERGQSATLSWTTTNATDVSIEGLGPVPPTGSRQVQPPQSTTYRLTAKSSGGDAMATARVTVTNPATVGGQPNAGMGRNPSEEEIFNQDVRTIYFDYNSFEVRPDQRSAMQGNAAFLQAHPQTRVVIEGHCDERGTAEYNLGLGDKRANSLREALVGAGIAAERIRTVSYGKERPVCTGESEACFQKNRRGQFVLDR